MVPDDETQVGLRIGSPLPSPPGAQFPGVGHTPRVVGSSASSPESCAEPRPAPDPTPARPPASGRFLQGSVVPVPPPNLASPEDPAAALTVPPRLCY